VIAVRLIAVLSLRVAVTSAPATGCRALSVTRPVSVKFVIQHSVAWASFPR